MTALWRGGWARLAPAAVAVVALALLAGPPSASPAPRKEIPVPLGFWFGSGKFADVTAKVGDVDVHITRGEYSISLVSDSHVKGYLNTEGYLLLDFFGSGELNVNGVQVTGNLKFHGAFDLGDLPHAIWADGSYRMTGVVIVNGFPVDIDQVIAVTSPLTLTDATCTKIRGELPSGIGAYRWTAKLKYDLGTECSTK